MNRTQWKALQRDLRREWRETRRGLDSLSRAFPHNGTSWHLVRRRDLLTGKLETVAQQRIITDRSPRARVANELDWARRYRLDSRASYPSGARAHNKRAARACALDARATLAACSAFHALPR